MATILFIAAVLLLAVGIYIIVTDIRMRRNLLYQYEDLSTDCDILSRNYGTVLTDLLALPTKAAVMEEDEETGHFTVCRYGDSGLRYKILSIPYDRNDPEDREYKRVCAEDVVEMLNQKI